MKQVFEFKGRTFESKPGVSCSACAFSLGVEGLTQEERDFRREGCIAQGVCAENHIVWVEKQAASTDVKLSNPKDSIGIRKAPLSCVPMNVVAEAGAAMLEGAAKYGRHNYRAVGVRSSVYFDATMRHTIAYWEGEDLDPDSGVNHLTKAIVTLMVWRDALMQGKCEDDRPPRSKPFYPDLNEVCSSILDRHADKSPHHYTIKDSE